MAALKHLSGLLISWLCLTLVQGAPLGEEDSTDETGLARDLNEFKRCHGFKCEVLAETKQRITDYKLTQAERIDQRDQVSQFLQENPEETETIDRDIWVSPEQAVELLDTLRSRQKRKLAQFNSKNQKWESPVGFIIDSALSPTVRATIREAMKRWGEATCLQFREMPESALPDGILSFIKPDYNLIYFHPGYQCASYVGRILWSQPIQLGNSCGSNFGAVAHEVGHALGFWHEHQRADRDDYVSVYPANMDKGVDPWQVEQKGNTQDRVPYDYSSLMHYNAWAFTSLTKAVNTTILPHNPLYLHTIGQKVEISFWDAKLANMAYCGVTTNGVTELCYHGIGPGQCQHSGYQDPKDCNKCRCPDGFTGKFCEELELPKKASCGGTFFIQPGQDMIIKSPNYDSRQPYEDYTECTWMIETPQNCRPVFHFDGDRFGTYCYWTRTLAAGACYHWLEVRYQNLTQTGPRFCCDRWAYKDLELPGELNKMMLLFRTPFLSPSDKSHEKVGFKARVSAVCTKDTNEPAATTPTTTTTTTTIPTTTTTTTTASTTPSTTTTTTPPKTATTKPTTTTSRTPPANPGSTPQCTKGGRDKRLDLAFVVDSSGSVGVDNWYRLRNFTKDIASKYSIGPHCLQVGFISFSTDGRIRMNFTAGSVSIESIETQLRSFVWQAGWSNTADGIRKMWQTLFTPSRGDRQSVRNMGILITDGKSNKDAWQTTSEAAKAKYGTARVNMMVIGVTDKVDDDEMLAIASSKDQVFKVDDFEQLSNSAFLNDIRDKIDEYSDLGPEPGSTTTTTTTATTTNLPNNLTHIHISPTSGKSSSVIHVTTRLHANTPSPNNGQTTPQPGGKDEPDNPARDFSALDIAFILDSSGSVGENNWSYLLGFVRKFVSSIRIGENDNLVGLVSYGNEATIHFGLKTYSSTLPMSQKLYSEFIGWKDQWTNAASGMLATRYNVFSMEQGNRPWAADVAILITDGVSNRYNNHTVPEAEAMRNAGIYIFVIGVGDRFDADEALSITGSESRVLRVSSYDSLHQGGNIESVKHMIGQEVSGSRGDEEWSWSCDFESRNKGDTFCGMTQENRKVVDKFDWSLGEYGTPSQETGPSQAYDGTHFMFIEASAPRRPNDKAIIYMPPFATPGTYCLTFYYNMNGYHVSRLALIRRIQDDLGIDQMWYEEGDHQDIWYRKQYAIYTSHPNEQFGFLATVGKEFSGDISVDSIHVSKGLCSDE